jgi:hypothetical protein
MAKRRLPMPKEGGFSSEGPLEFVSSGIEVPFFGPSVNEGEIAPGTGGYELLISQDFGTMERYIDGGKVESKPGNESNFGGASRRCGSWSGTRVRRRFACERKDRRKYERASRKESPFSPPPIPP